MLTSSPEQTAQKTEDPKVRSNRLEAGKWLNNYEYEAKLVQYLEKSDNPQSRNKDLEIAGSNTKLALGGYVTLIKSFVQTQEKNGRGEEHKELKEFCGKLEENLKYMPARKEYGEKIYQELEKNGSSITNYVSSEGKHANFIKFYKEGNDYYCKIYNAGEYLNTKQKNYAQEYKGNWLGNKNLNTKIDSEGYVTYPSVTYKMDKKYGIEKAVGEIVGESGKLSNKEITEKNEKRFESSIRVQAKDDEVIVRGQRVGNCTTRGIREALRDNIPQSSFRELSEYINNTPYSKMVNETLKEGDSYSKAMSPLTKAALVEYKNNPKVENTTLIVGSKIKDAIPTIDFKKDQYLFEPAVVVLKTDEKIKPYLKSLEGVQFVTDVLTRDTVNGPKVNESGKEVIKTDVNNFSFYERGMNAISKKVLIENKATDFAKDNKIDEKLTKELYNKMFSASFKDRDLPITSPMLKPVEDHLKAAISKNQGLNEGNLNKVLQDWQISTLTGQKSNVTPSKAENQAITSSTYKTDKSLETILKNPNQAVSRNNDVDDMIRAPVLKGLIDNNREQYNKLSAAKLPENMQAYDYHTMIKKSQEIQANVKGRSAADNLKAQEALKNFDKRSEQGLLKPNPPKIGPKPIHQPERKSTIGATEPKQNVPSAEPKEILRPVSKDSVPPIEPKANTQSASVPRPNIPSIEPKLNTQPTSRPSAHPVEPKVTQPVPRPNNPPVTVKQNIQPVAPKQNIRPVEPRADQPPAPNKAKRFKDLIKGNMEIKEIKEYFKSKLKNLKPGKSADKQQAGIVQNKNARNKKDNSAGRF